MFFGLEVDHPYAAASGTSGRYGDQQGRVYGVGGAMALNHHTVGVVMQKTFSTGENLLMYFTLYSSLRCFSSKNNCFQAAIPIDC